MDAADLERWRQADVEFERLLGLPVAARPSRLDELDATDPVVCERVRNLLLAHETDGGILDRARAAAGGSARRAVRPPARPLAA